MKVFLSGNRAGAALFALPLPAAVWFLSDPAAAGRFLSFGGYWVMLALALGWAALLAGRLRGWLPLLRANAAGLLFSLAVASSLFLVVKPEFRILADEANLLGVSRSMAFERRTDNVTMAKDYYFNLNPLQRKREKRPYMYPFFVSVLHSVSGFRPANAFAVNFLLLAALLGAIFIFFRVLYGAPAACAAVLLAGAQPLMALTAASGGMEFMSAVFMFFSFLALGKFLREPSRGTFSLLWATLLVMANVRYEGPAVMGAVFIGLLAFRRIKWEYLASWPFFLTPLFMLPAFCQRFCLPTNFENPAGVAPFAAGNILPGTLAFFKAHFKGLQLPYSLPVLIAGLAGAVYGLRRWLGSGGEGGGFSRPLAAVTLAGLSVYWLVTVSYYFSEPSEPSVARYFIAAVLALALSASFLVGEILSRRPAAAAASVAAAAALLLVYLPAAGENRFMNQLILSRRHKLEAGFLEKLGERRVLVVSERPGLFVSRGYGAVSFAYARENSGELLGELDRKLYGRIIVMQEIYYSDGEATSATDPGPDYELSPLYEAQNKSASCVRISEVRRRKGKY